jgi:hypothetical protein
MQIRNNSSPYLSTFNLKKLIASDLSKFHFMVP